MSLNDNGLIADCGRKVNSASCTSGDSENHKDNRRKLRIEDIYTENKDFAEDLLTMLKEFRDVVTIKDENLDTCNILQHQIRLKDNNCCINESQYKIPHKYKC